MGQTVESTAFKVFGVDVDGQRFTFDYKASDVNTWHEFANSDGDVETLSFMIESSTLEGDMILVEAARIHVGDWTPRYALTLHGFNQERYGWTIAGDYWHIETAKATAEKILFAAKRI